MRDQGWGEDELDIERAEVEQLREPGRVWPENWQIAQVFRNCRWEVLAGFGGVHWYGIAAREIESASRMLAVPRALWPSTIAGVRLMEAAAAPLLNEKKN